MRSDNKTKNEDESRADQERRDFERMKRALILK